MQRCEATQSRASPIKACNDQSPGGDQTGPSSENCAGSSTATPSSEVVNAEGCPETIQHVERPLHPFPVLSLVAYNHIKDRNCHALAAMDTGAEANVLREEIVGRLGMTIDPTEKPFFHALVGDGDIQALGKVELRFYLEEKRRFYDALFFVLENSTLPKTRDVLLSESFVHRENVLVFRTPYRARAIKVFYACCEALASLASAAQDPDATTAPTVRAIGWTTRPISSDQHVIGSVAIVAAQAEDEQGAS